MNQANAVVNVTRETFPSTIEKGIVVLDFWAKWCGPCVAFAPTFSAAAGRHPDVVFGKVDTEAQPALAAAFGIRAIPTLAVFRDGVLLSAEPGALAGPALEELIGEVRALDMQALTKATQGGTP